jgi:hypothetical protein
MIQIRKEAEEIITGKQPKENNLLKNAPHPLSVIILSEQDWNRLVANGLLSRNDILNSLVVRIRVRPPHIQCHGLWKGRSGRPYLE